MTQDQSAASAAVAVGFADLALNAAIQQAIAWVWIGVGVV